MGPRFFTKMNYMKSGKYMRLDALLSSRLNIDEKLVKVKLFFFLLIIKTFIFFLRYVKKQIIYIQKQRIV
jgi:hypothetical protein